MDGSRILKEKVANSKKFGYVWTRHKFLPTFFLKGPPLVILEFVPHGDLLGYLRKSNGENDVFYDLKSKEVPSKIPQRQLYQFSADIARGMEFISAHQVC